MLGKNNLKNNLKEVRIGAFNFDQNQLTEPIGMLELDESSLKTIICYINGDIAIDKMGNEFYILQREENGKIKGTECSKIKSKKLYALDVKDIELSKKEQKEFFKFLNHALKNKNNELDNSSKKTR